MINYNEISQKICDGATLFGFLEARIAAIKIDPESQNNFNQWLSKNFHGEMNYLAKNTHLRFNPNTLHDNTLSIICVKCPYLTDSIKFHEARLNEPQTAYISNYALGRDYHKVLKKQLKKYSDWIIQLVKEYIPNFDINYRVFTDSAPIMEVELAKNAGLGFRGKNTLLLNTTEGSTFFLGEIFTNLPLIPHQSSTSHCGTCTKCIDICPTNAFVAPYILDAKKCISYLTIEHKGSIPHELRPLIGNRIYGCDDCQLVCPWNKFSQYSKLDDFKPRYGLANLTLVEAFLLTKHQWENLMQGSAIYRIGYNQWLRNVAVALGNATTSNLVIETLQTHASNDDPNVREHVLWALAEHKNKLT